MAFLVITYLPLNKQPKARKCQEYKKGIMVVVGPVRNISTAMNPTAKYIVF